MTCDEWRDRIKEACIKAGTYKGYFDSVIETLAEILEARDDARQKFIESGGDSVVTYTNQRGQTNVVKNPALVVVDDMNKTALAYWRDLGLTPAGLKRINEGALKESDGKPNLGKVLEGLGI